MMSLLLSHAATVLNYNTLPKPNATTDTVTTILNIVAGITASIALLMAVIGGFRYILARGNPQDAASARNTIIYAVVGLIITILAYSIVLFVIGNITT